MQSIEMSALDDFSDRLNDLLISIPDARRKLHEELAEMVKQEVDAQIVSSGINDEQGKIRNWQEYRVGSYGGYAAVSAKKGINLVGDNSPGAITNYLASGHKIREPSGKSRRYKPKIKVPYVSGRHFYQSARRNVIANAIDLAEKFADELASKLKG